jgi:pimeloyl-ACP methyl ester carboxylesterase
MSTLKTIQTKVLQIAFLDEGPATGWPVALAYGFPYDVHAYDEVAPRLAKAGARGRLLRSTIWTSSKG